MGGVLLRSAGLDGSSCWVRQLVGTCRGVRQPGSDLIELQAGPEVKQPRPACSCVQVYF